MANIASSFFKNLYRKISVEIERHRAEVGKRIKRLRQAQEITVHELARRSNISAGYLSEVERGLSAVSIDKLKQVAEGLGMRVDVLVGDSEETEGQSVIEIPAALSSAAELLKLSHRATVALSQGQRSLLARRSKSDEAEWNVKKWIEFYEKVKNYLPDC